MQAYDLVAIDIDGTLLDSQNHVSEAVWPLLREMEARGTGATLISGRPYLSVAPLQKSLGLKLPAISAGGAYISDPTTGEVIASFLLRREEVKILAEVGRESGSGLVIMESQRLYYEGSIEKFTMVHKANNIDLSALEKIKASFILVDDIVTASSAPLKFTISDMPDVLAVLEERIRGYDLPLYATYSSPAYLEFTQAAVNKGTALQRLAQHLNIPLERVLVIGDSPNDLSMFQVAGMAVAMGNATPEVKGTAHLIAPSNDEDGVAWVLRNVVLVSVPSIGLEGNLDRSRTLRGKASF